MSHTHFKHTHILGNVVWSVVAPLAMGSMAGSFFGGKEIALRVRACVRACVRVCV